jgi:protein tyrosine phosphatase
MGVSDFTEDKSLLMAYLNFGWIWPGRLAACRAPRSDDDISKLSTLGVRAIVRLEHFDIPTDSVQSAGIDDWLEPVVDFGAPTQDQIERTVHFVLRAISGSKPTAVSCGAGYGRTATVLACVLIASGLDFEDALQELARSNTRRKPETSQQRESIRLFAERVRKTRFLSSQNRSDLPPPKI